MIDRDPRFDPQAGDTVGFATIEDRFVSAMGDAVSVSYPGSTYGVGVGDDGQLCTFPIANPRRCSCIMTLAGWWHRSGWLRSAEYLESEFAG